MTYIVNKNFDPIAYLCDEYYKAPPMSVNTSKTAQAQAASLHAGVRDGIARAIGAILTEQRIKKYPLLENRWELLMPFDVAKVLRPLAVEFPAPNRDEHAALIERAIELLMDLMNGDENFQAAYAQLRRDAILSGKYSMDMATDDDKAYFKQRAFELKEEAERMAGFVSPDA